MREVEHRSFSPLVFSVSGGMGPTARRLAAMIAFKHSQSHSQTTFDSIEHCVLLQSLFEMGVNGRLSYQGLLFKPPIGSPIRVNLSAPFSVTRGAQQFFLTVMDKLLQNIKDTSAGLSLCCL